MLEEKRKVNIKHAAHAEKCTDVIDVMKTIKNL